MLDSSDMPLLICGVMFAGVLSLAASSGSPPGPALTLDETRFPLIPVAEDPGGEPLQTDVPTQIVDVAAGFQAELLFAYALDGVVVSRRVFRGRGVNQISPLDLGIVWGDLAEGDAIDSMRFTAGRRVLTSRTDDISALPQDWARHITNNHLIPASDTVREALLAVEIGQRVRITGFLVNVTGETTSPWRSSITRDDGSIVSGCEIILVRGVEVIG
ncbi:hypothetical protein A8B78_11715 [Jannaschia sp. EhC01]|nr:hypothetical protein A8B78_11715 [Jannaschia sp. EhC01]